MPTVAVIDGVKIQFYWDEHPPSHFHAEYAEYRAIIAIETLEILEGSLPGAQIRKVVSWARTRRPQLLSAWIACQADDNPGKIR
jgi:hypothetical protein